MLIAEIKKIKSTRKELREFGFVVGGAAIVFALIAFWRKGVWHWPLAACGGALIFLGLVLPQVLRPLQRVWMAAALVMGWVMSRVILAVLFFLILTPIALWLRSRGKRFLGRGPDPSARSYWNLRTPESADPKRCERQY